MRVWLIDDRSKPESGDLEGRLRQLEAAPEAKIVLAGVHPYSKESLVEIGRQQVELIVVHEPALPTGEGLEALLALHLGVLMAISSERAARYEELAAEHSLWFIPNDPALDCLWLGLLSAGANRSCRLSWQNEIQRLNQRLTERIVIEKAKGVLVQRLGIGEDEAYSRLRLLSRRQRRPIKDVAQSFLDTQSLLLPEHNVLSQVEESQ